MKILYIIALVSFAALAWAAFAITRHVRKSSATAQPPLTDTEDNQALEDRLTGLSRSGERESAPAASDTGNSGIRPLSAENEPKQDGPGDPGKPAVIDHQ